MGAPISESATLRPQSGEGTTKSIWTCGGIGRRIRKRRKRRKIIRRTIIAIHIG
jgi:hypothetical protein